MITSSMITSNMITSNMITSNMITSNMITSNINVFMQLKYKHVILGIQQVILCRLELKESKCLFNDALNTFYLRLYNFRHMVKDHSDSERRNPLPPLDTLSGYYIPRPLLPQLWCIGWNEK